MKFPTTSNRFFLLCLAAAAFRTHAAVELACPFLPIESAPAIEYTLPVSVLSHPLKDLPLEFDGLVPVVTRKSLPFGAIPRVVIERYSSQPSVTYDEKQGIVVVASAACSADNIEAPPTESRSAQHSVSWMVLAGSVLVGLVDESTRSYAWALALSAVLLSGGASAHEDTCMPSVKVIIEAPAAYMGAVETCMAEINDPMVCPTPFPTFDTCEDATPTCSVAVVGAAAGGLYTAMRLVDSGRVPASEICIFEMTGRVGGRVYSLRGLGPDNDLTVDIGGYRTWPEFTPALHALVTEYLGFSVECYDDSDPCTKFNIVDETGNKNGFATFLEEMLQQLVDGGACWYPYHELVKIEKVDPDYGTAVGRTRMSVPNNYKLHFANGVVASSSFATVLNTPQRPLLKIVRNSNFDAVGLMDLPKLEALHSGHVFWYKLGLFSGDFDYPGDAQNMLLGGRYSDGHVRCDDPDDLDTCHGFLLAVYVTDFSGNKAQYFRRFQRDRPEPVTIISNDDLEGGEFLKHAHQRLVEFHTYENVGAPYSGFQASQVFGETDPPLFAVLGTWNSAIPWAGGAYHGWTDLDKVDLAIEPFVEDNIFVVTEAYSKLHGWAEGSIKVADQVLEKYLNVSRPWSFPVEDIEQRFRDTSSQGCTADPSDSSANSDVITLGEVGLHNTEDDCWSVIYGDVYDLTRLVTEHSGPADPIIAICGIEGTFTFASKHSQSILNRLANEKQGPVHTVPIEDVSLHDSPDDCWSVINGIVYDLTTLVVEHSGPSGPVEAVCGIDGTEGFDQKHINRTQELLTRISGDIVAPLGGSNVVVDPFCFAADSLVRMADGSTMPIKDVRQGDVVDTGTGFGGGRVTKKLVHPVGKHVFVAIVETEYGRLLGTPTHPILHNGSWIELGTLVDDLVDLNIQFVDAFYNLEVDADTPGKSSHSYVVNGVVASGLGDNEDLNLLYPRQQVWKNAQVKSADTI